VQFFSAWLLLPYLYNVVCMCCFALNGKKMMMMMISFPSLQTFKRALKMEHFANLTTAHTIGNSGIDTSLIRDIYCGPEVLFETCIAMKFVNDDDVNFIFLTHVFMFELFMYVYSCNALSARFCAVVRALNSYFMIMIIIMMMIRSTIVCFPVFLLLM